MNPSVVCYPQPGKKRSRLVLEAFAAGCGGRVAQQAMALEPGAAAFYGVVGIEHLPRLAVDERRTWFYGDNAFFDVARGRFFRFARNALQIVSARAPDDARLRALGLSFSPWQRNGRHIVVVEQSEHFMALCGAEGWLGDVLRVLDSVTDRPVRVRRWRRDKDKAAAGLRADLRDAWALVTHMSAAANEALLAGVPVFVSGACAAAPMASGPLENIERPRYPEGREEWAAGLAGAQWTLDELRAGVAWRALMEPEALPA